MLRQYPNNQLPKDLLNREFELIRRITPFLTAYLYPPLFTDHLIALMNHCFSRKGRLDFIGRCFDARSRGQWLDGKQAGYIEAARNSTKEPHTLGQIYIALLALQPKPPFERIGFNFSVYRLFFPLFSAHAQHRNTLLFIQPTPETALAKQQELWQLSLRLRALTWFAVASFLNSSDAYTNGFSRETYRITDASLFFLLVADGFYPESDIKKWEQLLKERTWESCCSSWRAHYSSWARDIRSILAC
ncbi:MAG: hypothetical protein AAF355_15505 [Myxococcota bacterium]